MNEIYFDNAATTRLSERVRCETLALLDDCYGNPSSLHHLGFQAEQVIKKAVGTLASLLDVTPSEIVYTSGGTESNNTAIFGVASANRGKRVVTVSTEHPSVLEPFKQLAQRGYDVVFLPVDENGLIRLEQLSESVDENTCLVSVMAVNNEVGTMQDLERIGEEIKRKNSEAYFHVDGVQAFGKHRIDLKKCQIDLFSVSGHKIHAPKGVGALYVRKGTRVNPLIYGGGQQRNFRSGTENVIGIHALSAAAEEAFGEMDRHREAVAEIKERIISGLRNIEGVEINGGLSGSPYILNVSFPGVKSEVLLHSMESEGVYVSSGSACSSKSKHNAVLAAYGLSRERADSAVRMSFSWRNTVEEADYAVKRAEKVLPVLRRGKGVVK